MRRNRANESDLQKKVMSRLKSFGGYVRRNVQGPYSRVGTPDIEGVWHGIFWAIELKRKGKKADKLQAKELIDIQTNGGMVAVVDDMSALEAFLGSIERSRENV